MGIEQFLDLANTASSENANATAALKYRQGDIAQKGSDLITSAMQSILGTHGQKYQGELDAQTAAIAERNNLGNNPQDPNSAVAQLTQTYRDATQVAQQQRAQIAKKEQVGFFDNPLEYLFNYVTLPDEKNALAATEGMASSAATRIKEMQDLTTTSAQAAKATSETMTKVSIAQQLDVDAAEAQLKANGFKKEALGFNVDAIAALEKGNTEQVTRLLQLDANKRSNEELNIHRDNSKRLADEWDEKLKRERLDQAGADRAAEIASRGAAAFGLPQLTAAELKYMKKNGQLSPEMEKVLTQQGIYMTTSGDNTLGKTVGDVTLNMLAVKGLTDPAHTQIRQVLSDAATKAFDEYKLQHPNAKLDDQTKADISAKITETLYGPNDPKRPAEMNFKRGTLFSLLSDVDKPGNPFRAPDLKVLAALPDVKENPIYKDVIAPAAAVSNDSSLPAMIAQTEMAISKGLITKEQAAVGISQLYQSAMNQNNVTNDVARLRLPLQNQYIGKVPSAFSIYSGATDQIDGANAGTMYQYFTLKEAGRRMVGQEQ